jgi:hypothetical protein
MNCWSVQWRCANLIRSSIGVSRDLRDWKRSAGLFEKSSILEGLSVILVLDRIEKFEETWMKGPVDWPEICARSSSANYAYAQICISNLKPNTVSLVFQLSGGERPKFASEAWHSSPRRCGFMWILCRALKVLLFSCDAVMRHDCA